MPPRSSRKRERSEPETSSKRLRFDDSVVAAADDRAFEETVEEGLETSARQAKRVVNVDGYESDSTDDGEGVVLSRRSGANEAADEDDDMFAPSGAGGKEGKGGGDADDEDGHGDQKEKILELGDIEGQEFGRTATGADDDEDDDDEPVDEDEAERRAKKGMGFEITAFNMKEEMEEGKFVDDGTFVRALDPHQMHDRWLEGMSDREIKKARKQKERREKEEAERQRRENEDDNRPKEEDEKELVGLLKKGETVLEALQRLGAEAKKAGGSKPKPKKRAAPGPAAAAAIALDVDPVQEPNGYTNGDAAPTPVERITALASNLMGMGNMDIYDESYESLLRSVRRAGIVPQSWVPPSSSPPRALSPPPEASSTQYEYRWSPIYLASAGGETQSTQTFGPFANGELDAWRAAGYFGGMEAAERVEVRRVGDTEWVSWPTLFRS